MVKVYLINPPAYRGVKMVREGRCMQRSGAWTSVWAPISLTTIAAVLEKDNITVKLDDCIVEEIGFFELQKRLKEFKPDLVIINTATPSITSDLKVASLAKKASKKCKTLAFGIHVTALPEDSLRMEKDLDIVVRGEPEITIREIAIAIGTGRVINHISGISYRMGNKINHNNFRLPLNNLDELPFPAWRHVKIEKYQMPFKNSSFLLVGTSRGCPYKCKFCADREFYGDKLRLKSPSRIVDEIEWIKKEFGVDDFLFWAESFTINKRFAREVAEEIITRKLNISWVCNSRVDNVDLSLLKIFSQAGCWMIGFGIESGNQNILNLMDKRTTIDQAKRAVMDAHEAGLEVTGHCLIGYPGETKATINKTLQFVKDLDLDFAQFYCAVPFPGSELYKSAQEKEWMTERNWDLFEQNFSILTTPQLAASEVMELRQKAYKDFYFRPKMIWKTIRRVHSSGELLALFRMMKDFVSWL